MKKILLSLMIMAVIGFTAKLQAQSCNLTTPLIKYTNGNNNGVAPFFIDGLISDWETNILGAQTGNAITPFNPPLTSGANFSLDGTELIGPDLDSPTPPRDLRFFSFTYDDYNVYFYFRRINNSTSQNTFMYCMDVNADGFMNNGEPVIRANFNSSGISAFAIHPYEVNVAVDYVAGKGNYMVDPVTGIADGYSVVGDFGAAVSLAGFPLIAPQVFAAENTESGFGTEFAVPWSYLRNWINPNSNTPLSSGDVFTYHVLTQNGSGSTTTDDATDNAGGCCSGLASIGNAKYSLEVPVVSKVVANLEYNALLKINNTGNAPIKVSLDVVSLGDIIQFDGRPIDENQFSVKVYIDANGDGILSAADLLTEKIFTYGNGTFIAQPINYFSPTPKDTLSIPTSSSGYFLINLKFPPNLSVKSLKAQFETRGILNLPLGPCQQEGTPQSAPTLIPIVTTLPVVFTNFTATRAKSNVFVKWVTSSEINNSGFAIERSIDGVNWQEVGFVASQAVNGNSSQDLSYQFIDLNKTKSISQYRIKQVDIDSKSKYSEVRSVIGEGQIGKVIVYPNPTSDGRVNIVFEDATIVRDISVIDMSGRIVKSMRGNANTNITIENLKPGMYTVRIFVPATGEQLVEKVLVNQK